MKRPRPDHQRIAELEYELELTDEKPPRVSGSPQGIANLTTILKEVWAVDRLDKPFYS